jgi:hypothetical protein
VSRYDDEDASILSIAIRVEDDAETVRVIERRVATRVGRRESRRIAIEQDSTEVDRPFREDDADLGAL